MPTRLKSTCVNYGQAAGLRALRTYSRQVRVQLYWPPHVSSRAFGLQLVQGSWCLELHR
jgi:hypothetical protein